MAGNQAVPKVTDRTTRPETDRARLGRMFEAHHATMWRVLRRKGLTPETAADVTQETFLIAAERLTDIHPYAERAFLIATALRAAQTAGRKTARWHLDDAMHLRASAGRDAGETHADIELCDLVLSKINPELAEVFVLYEAEGFSSREIADLLGIPRGSVASRLRRAREQFRAIVSNIGPDLKGEGRP